MRGPVRTLIVLPDADRVEHALLAAAQRDGFVDARGFTTLTRVLAWCEAAKHLGRRPCPALTARLVLSACAAKLPQGQPFGAWAKEPGFAREACTLIAHLKSQRATPDDLVRAADRLPPSPTRSRGRALAQLWKDYDAGLLQLELADREDLTAAAIDVLRKGLPEAFAAFGRITVQHLYDWPPLRLELVTALARACHARDIEFLLELPRANAPQVDALTDEAMGTLERAGAEDAAFVQGVELVTTPEQKWAVERLFAEAAAPVEGSAASHLEAFSSATALDELREIARRVRAALDAGASAEHVAIAFRSLEGEAEAAVAALAEKGVSARSRRGVPLASTALGRLALGLPQLVEEHFPSDQLAHYLESHYVHAARTESDPEVVFRAAAIRDDLLGAEGGVGAYEVRLLQLAQRARGADDRDRCRAVLQDVKQFMAMCARLGEARTLGDQLEAWSTLVSALGLLDGVGKGEAIDDGAPALARAAERALAHDQAAAQAIEALGTSLTQALKQSRLAKTPTSLAAFSRWLADASADINLTARGARAGAVRVLDVRELFGRPLTHLFVGGLVDGRFPSRPTAASLLSDAAKVELNRSAGRPLFRVRAGEGDDRLLTREAEDRLLFIHALCAAPKVTLSHPRIDAEGSNTLPSPWLHGLTHGAARVALERLPLGAPPPLDRVHAGRELRLRVALEALSDPRTRLSKPDDAQPLFARAFGHEPWFAAAQDVSRIERERFEFFEKTDDEVVAMPHSGGLQAPDLVPILARRLAYGPDHPLSGSTLKHWGNCAFAGFSGHLLKLSAPDFQQEELGAREKGTFLHAVAEKLLPRLKEAGLLGLPRGPQTLAKVAPHLEAALDAATESTRGGTAHGNPLLWPMSRALARRSVLRVVVGETALPFRGAEPAAVEQRFGTAGDSLGVVVFPAALEGESDVSLQGKIDRVDEGNGRVGVLDYKSATTRGPKALKEEFLVSEFQLPIYLFAMRTARSGVDLEAAWQSFKDGKVAGLDKAVEGDLDLETLLATEKEQRLALGEDENLGNALHGLLRKLRHGEFGARPLDCKYCDFKRVCRISDRRLSAEDPVDGA